MELNRNTIHHMKFQEGLKLLPDKCANLIICDPPYFRVKGEFDFQMTWEEWLQMHEELAKECSRVIADNGSLFLFGDRRNIAYAQVIFDKYFTFENHIFWQKASKSMVERFTSLRSFPERGFERILFYSTGMEPGEWDNFNEVVDFVFQPVLDWFISAWRKSGLTRSEVDKACQTKNVTQYWFLKRNYQIPTKEKYTVLQRLAPAAFSREYEDLRREYEDLRRQYEDLRRQYEDLRRPFDNFLKLSDHWYFTNGDHSEIDHDTPKPEKLTRAMILTTTRPGDLVLVPFAGSGTECAMAAKEGRQFIGFDTNEKYVKDALKRCEQYTKNRQLTIMDALAKTG